LKNRSWIAPKSIGRRRCGRLIGRRWRAPNSWRKSAPVRAHVIGRLAATGERILAATNAEDQATPSQMAADDPLGAKINVSAAREGGSRFSL
jgi:hypothetical protein